MSKKLKQILENQYIIDSKLTALMDNNGMQLSEFKTVNPTIKPPKPSTGG
jgi:hypothetical protein